MRVLFASSEIYPLAKTGGLADVSAALPLALAEMGVEIALLMPGYPPALAAAANKSVVAEIADLAGVGVTRLIEARMPDTGLAGLAGRLPDAVRPARRSLPGRTGRRIGRTMPAASRCSAASLRSSRPAISSLNWRPDVVHANDWHTGLVPAYLDARPGATARHPLHDPQSGLSGAIPRLGVPQPWAAG